MRRYYGSRCQRTYIKSTKIPGFHAFFGILGIPLDIPSISNSRCKKPSLLKFLIRNTQYFNRNPRLLIEILGISIEILGFLFEILVNQVFLKYLTIVFHEKEATQAFRKLLEFLSNFLTTLIKHLYDKCCGQLHTTAFTGVFIHKEATCRYSGK